MISSRGVHGWVRDWLEMGVQGTERLGCQNNHRDICTGLSMTKKEILVERVIVTQGLKLLRSKREDPGTDSW